MIQNLTRRQRSVERIRSWRVGDLNFDNETEQSIAESENEPLKETDEENELRFRSPWRRKQERFEEKQHRLKKKN